MEDCLAERDGFEPPVPLVSGESGRFLPVSVLCQRRSARLKRTGERLASDSDQSDEYVCPAKERAGMKRNPSRSGARGLADELAELRGLDLTAPSNAGGRSTAPKRRSTSARRAVPSPIPLDAQ